MYMLEYIGLKQKVYILKLLIVNKMIKLYSLQIMSGFVVIIHFLQYGYENNYTTLAVLFCLVTLYNFIAEFIEEDDCKCQK